MDRTITQVINDQNHWPIFLLQVFIDNFVHADLHPGNILVQGVANYQPSHSDDDDYDGDIGYESRTVRLSKKDCPLKLVLLDTGIVGHLTEQDRQNLHQVILAVALGKVLALSVLNLTGRGAIIIFFFFFC